MKIAAFVLAVTAALVVWTLEATGFASTAFLGLLLLLALLALPVLLVVALARRDGRIAAIAFVPAAVFVTSMAIARWIVRLQVAATKERGDRLAVEIEAHRTRTGTYPHALADLVPAGLEVVPTTAMGVFASRPFQYFRDGDSDFRLAFENSGWTRYCRTRSVGWQWED